MLNSRSSDSNGPAKDVPWQDTPHELAEEQRLRQAAESEDPAAWIQLGSWLLKHGRSAREYGPWLRKARSRRLNALDGLLDLRLNELVGSGEAEEAFKSLFLSGASSEVEAVLRVVLRVEEYSPGEVEAWYRRAADTREPAGFLAYGRWLERVGRGTEAGPLYEEAAGRGDREGALALARWQAARGQRDLAQHYAETAVRQARLDVKYAKQTLRRTLFEAGDVALLRGNMEAMQDLYDRAESIEQFEPARAPTPWVTAVSAATVTILVVPFIQALASQAAQGSYEAARNVLRRMFRRGSDRRDTLAQPSERILIAEDFGHQLTLYIPTEATDEALDALAQLDLSSDSPGCRGKLRWNSALRKWEYRP